ncbi:MAG: TlpA family protein disulfide reductase [Planctomycetes bacterium]|nr:TlpA family protein disulfide reductase [Planctomycetota bacterium]MBI3843565.1 TlpA family protein disulfide reductase [Planctomycetota bacterium]
MGVDSSRSSPLRLAVIAFGLTVLSAGWIGAVRAQAPPAFSDSESLDARFKRETDGYEKAFDAFENSATLDQCFSHDLSPCVTWLRSQMREGATPAIRATAAAYLATLRDYDVVLGVEDFREIARVAPPDSSAWKDVPRAIRSESEGLPVDDAKRFLDALVVAQSDRVTRGRAHVANTKLASRRGDFEAYRQAFAKLSTFKDVDELRFEIATLDPDNAVALGKKAPSFTLPAIGEREGATVTNDVFAGSYYLVEFWATWCGPCMGERAALHRVHERFAGKNFAIISISLDDDAATVVRFRAKRWAMPWANAILPGGQKSKTAKDYGVDWIGLPRLVLVASDGTIVALEDRLGRESMERTIESFVGR